MAKPQLTVTTELVNHIAKLAQLPMDDARTQTLVSGFTEMLAKVANLSEVDISSVEPTHQVTGLANVLRDDTITPERMFTQSQALANAKHTHAGFFVVDQLIDKDSG